MITKRIIPCLDVRDGRVVKGVNFGSLHDVSSPVSLAKFYSESGADELVFYDITASAEGRGIFTDILKETARTVFIPLTVGGGISTLGDFERVLTAGADKVSVNSGAIKDPSLIGEAAKRYGSQCVVLSVDVSKIGGKYTVFSHGGRVNTGIDAIECNESTEVHKTSNCTFVLCTYLRIGDDARDDLLSLICSLKVRCGDIELTVVVDVDLGTGISDDLVDDLSAGTDNFTDLINGDLHGDDPGSRRLELSSGCRDPGKDDIVDDLETALMCHLESCLDDVK